MFDEKTANRNARLMILEGTIFWAGLSFLQGDTVITNFIRLTTCLLYTSPSPRD